MEMGFDNILLLDIALPAAFPVIVQVGLDRGLEKTSTISF